MGAEASTLESKLIAGLELGLSWTGGALHQFSLDDRFDLNAANLKEQIPQLKPISELALTIWLLNRCGIKHRFLEDVAAWIWKQIDSGKLLTKLLLARNDFLPCCSLYGPLYRLGYRSASLDAALALLSSSDMARVLPLPPWGALAMNYNLSLLNPTDQPLVSNSSLYINSLPEPWVISSEIAYAITHEVFYLTDFGELRIADEKVVEYLRIWLPFWSKIFMSESDLDLSGEFAMTLCCVAPDNHADLHALLSAILAGQRESGYVPGPNGAGTLLFQSGDTLERRVFLNNYHTTLVALMAYALAIRRV